MNVPEMGKQVDKAPLSAIASALFTTVQQRVLGILFGQPERRFQSAELIRLARSGTGAVHRQLQRLVHAGLVTVTYDGNQKYYQARKDSAVYPELHGLIVKTVGIVDPLRVALALIADRIDLAFWDERSIRSSSPAPNGSANTAKKDSFVARITSQRLLFIIGTDDAVE
jgi:hypothetical protein